MKYDLEFDSVEAGFKWLRDNGYQTNNHRWVADAGKSAIVYARPKYWQERGRRACAIVLFVNGH